MIADLIQKKQAEAAAAINDKKLKLDAENTELLRKAKAELDDLLGEMSEELNAIRQPGSGFTTGRDGRINSVSLVVQSDDLELASMEFHWSPDAKIYCTFGRDILDNRSSFDFSRPGVTLADALLYANRIFPEWKAKRDEVVTASRARRIESLLERRNWQTHNAHTANETYRQLKEIDPDIAENHLCQWKKSVIEEYSQCLKNNTEPERRDLAIRWRDYIGAADPELADELFAKWEEDAEAHVAQRAEKERARATHAAAMEQWRADLKEWAKKETARMWKPFSVTYVRYAPIGYTGSTDEDIDIIRGAYCIGVLEEVVAAAMKPGAILGVYSSGSIKKKAIGAFLDAETAASYTAEPPTIDSSVRFTREFYVGGVCINMPPFTDDMPTGCPVRPASPDGVVDSDEINF